MASIRFPILKLSNRTLQWGLPCKESHDGPPDDDGPKDWKEMYTKQGDIGHHEHCPWSRCLLTYLDINSLPRLELSGMHNTLGRQSLYHSTPLSHAINHSFTGI